MRVLAWVTALLVAAVPARATVAADADPALWVVKDADTTVYLFGTIHMLGAQLRWFDGPVERAFKASDELVIEVTPPAPAAMAGLVEQLAVDADGPPLSAKLPPDLRAAYLRELEQAGVPAAAFERFEPWFAGLSLALLGFGKAGLSPEHGAEAVLQAEASRAGKRVGALETADEQLRLLDGLSEPVQITMLRVAVEDLDEAEAEVGQLVARWAAGDADGLAALVREGLEQAPELKRVLFTQRNARWAEWIDERMDRPGTVFVAVGAGHLGGEGSVQDMLAKRGFAAERVR